jgi:hypothetical protein
MADALRASNALSPRLTSRIARISAEVEILGVRGR